MIEEKIIKKNNKELLGTYEHFGWKKQESDKISSSEILLVRDDNMPYFKEIKTLELKYEELQSEIIKPYKLIMPLFIFLALMLIIPGLVYKIVVNNHNARIEEPNNMVYEKMEEVLDKANRYVNV